MYSLVLMVSLSGGADLPAWQDAPGRASIPGQNVHELNRRRGGCHGCRGGGCSGGCYGGCYGGGYGCYGSGYGCCGGGYGGYGCGGGYYGAPGGRPMQQQSYYYGYEGQPFFYGGPDQGQYRGAPDQQGEPQRDRRPADRGRRPDEQGRAEMPATVIVRLPAEATLTIDDQPTRSTSDVRTFVSPPLEPGKTFHYVLKAQVVRDGKTLTRTERVAVEAGREARVTFDFAAAAE